MVIKRIKMKLDGTNPRNCAEIAKHACRFDSTIVVEYNGKTVSMKSLIGLISMGMKPGAEIVIRAEGTDEQAAAEEVCACLA